MHETQLKVSWGKSANGEPEIKNQQTTNKSDTAYNYFEMCKQNTFETIKINNKISGWFMMEMAH